MTDTKWLSEDELVEKHARKLWNNSACPVYEILHDLVQEALAAQRQRNAELLGALHKYGQHVIPCNSNSLDDNDDCDCGFEAALAKNGGTP